MSERKSFFHFALFDINTKKAKSTPFFEATQISGKGPQLNGG